MASKRDVGVEGDEWSRDAESELAIGCGSARLAYMSEALPQIVVTAISDCDSKLVKGAVYAGT